MAHYAFLNESNIVVEVITGRDETEILNGVLDLETYYGNLREQVCKRTSYNNNIRKQYAGVGYSYDPDADVFVAPQPFPSWTLDSNYDWQPPTPKPDGEWFWDEAELAWAEIGVA